jgi:hypothetical protein
MGGRIVFEHQAQARLLFLQGDGDGTGLADGVGMVHHMLENQSRHLFQAVLAARR